MEISATGAQCDRTNTGFECVLEIGAINPRLTLTNYAFPNKLLLACSDVLDIQGNETGTNSWTRFDLPALTSPSADIVIMEASGCP